MSVQSLRPPHPPASKVGYAPSSALSHIPGDDGWPIVGHTLSLLADPKGALPPYDAVLLVSPEHAHDAPLLAALKPLIGSIDLASMQRANLMVDRDTDKRSPEQVAKMLDSQITAHPHALTSPLPAPAR